MLAKARIVCAMVLIAVAGTSAAAQSAGDVFAGKTISLIISTGSGGGLDASARLIARHIGQHLPGKPSIVAKNMTGAGHLQATNYVYAQAPRDGTTMAAILPAFVGYQVLDGKGAQYDAAKFNWIGSSDVDNQNIYVWHTSGIRSIEDARTREVLMGATGAGSYTVLWPTVLNALAGTKFKIVSGYKATTEIHLAMERGEVHGRAGNLFSSLRSQNADYIKERKIVLLAQIGSERDAEFKDIPLLTELARSDDDKAVMALLSGEIAIGKPFLTTPEVAADRLNALRGAFEATTRDRGYLDEAERTKISVRAASHGQIKGIADAMLATPPELIARTKAALASANS